MQVVNDYRPDPQDGFSHDDELLYHAEIVVDGDYAGYEDHLDYLRDDDFPDMPIDYEEYGDAFSVAEFCYGWDGE